MPQMRAVADPGSTPGASTSVHPPGKGQGGVNFPSNRACRTKGVDRAGSSGSAGPGSELHCVKDHQYGGWSHNEGLGTGFPGTYRRVPPPGRDKFIRVWEGVLGAPLVLVGFVAPRERWGCPPVQ